MTTEQTNVTIGTGEIADSTSGMPFDTYFHDNRTEWIVLSNELEGEGVQVGSKITGIALKVADEMPVMDLQYFTVFMQEVSVPYIAVSSFTVNGWTTVKNPYLLSASQFQVIGQWIDIMFDTPFIWTGKHLLISTTRDNIGYKAGGSNYRVTVAPDPDGFLRMIAGYNDSETVYPHEDMVVSDIWTDSIVATKFYTEISLSPNAPEVPTNLLPEEGSTSRSVSATVSDIDGGDVQLQIEHSTDITFNSNVTTQMSASVASGMTATLDIKGGGYTNLQTFYMRARAYDGYNYSDWTPTRTLICPENKAPMISVAYPVNNAVVTETTASINLNINDAEGDAVDIEYQVTSKYDFSSIDSNIHIFSITGTQYLVSLPLKAGNNYYRFRANDSNGNYSNWTYPRGIYCNKPTQEKIYPNRVITQSNYNAPTVSQLSARDGVWATPTTLGTATVMHVGFPAPTSGTSVSTSGTAQFLSGCNLLLSATGTGSISTTLEVFISGTSIGSQAMNVFSAGLNEITTNLSQTRITNASAMEVKVTANGYSSGSGKTVIKGSVRIDDIYALLYINAPAQVPYPDEPINTPPNIVSATLSKNKISDEVGVNSSTLTFKFDKDITEWCVRVGGDSSTTGYNAGSDVQNVIANTIIQTTIDWNEGLVEGQNKINIYGKNAGGWTTYEA